MEYDWNFRLFLPYTQALLNGIWVTIELSVLSSFFGTVLGVILGFFLRIRIVDFILLPVNDILRAIPLLVLIYLFYYFPYQSLLGIEPLSEFTCALLALTLAQAVFTADIVRAAIDGVSQRTILGAQSLGFRQKQIWTYFIIPDIIRQTLPTQLAFYIGNIKLSSLASSISVQDVLYVAKVASGQSFRTLEAWILVALIYIILVLPLSYFSRKLEKSKWLIQRNQQ